jgi:hypothetical protein
MKGDLEIFSIFFLENTVDTWMLINVCIHPPLLKAHTLFNSIVGGAQKIAKYFKSIKVLLVWSSTVFFNLPE